MMAASTKVAGVILAGGQGRRMGGQDKALLRLAGISLIDHVFQRLSPQCGAIAISANGDGARFSRLGLPVLPDVLPDWPGPLAGVLTGMHWAAAHGFSHLVSVATDTPFFPTDLVARLQATVSPAGLTLAASPDANGTLRLHPTIGLWPVALHDDLSRWLLQGNRKVRLWADRAGAATCSFSAAPFDPFFNINTAEDLAWAAQRLADQSGSLPHRIR
jgi:molybdenum cofactor guanylyltransferase